MIKPMLATDFDESKLRFPCVAQPKLDGVRGLNLEGALTGRSLKSHANQFTTKKFSHPHFKGLDGELTVGPVTDPALCRTTTSAVTSIKGDPTVIWNVFDYITEDTIKLPYRHRYLALRSHLDELHDTGLAADLSLVPSHVCTTLEQLLELEKRWLDAGFEGVIIRDPDGMYKEGRSSIKQGGLLRIKRFMEEDCTVLAVIEGQSNGNEAKKNELGRTERSSHQENMVPNGLVGTLLCRLHKDVFDANSGALLLSKDQEITVSAGSMSHADRKHYFENPDEVALKTIKMKFFPKGILDKPRFPTFNGFRSESDKS